MPDNEPHRKLDPNAEGSVCSPETAALIRRAGADGAVLLKNEEGVLPLKPGEPVAVFGRAQLDWFHVGYGSGGNVLAEHRIGLVQGLEEAGVPLDEEIKTRYAAWCAAQEKKEYVWGTWPWSLEEMPLGFEDILGAAARCDTALVVIGRNAGEDRDIRPEKGSYYLTDAEEALLSNVTHTFKKTAVVLNVSNLTDLTWLERYHGVRAVLVCWLGGQESGRSAADVLTGRVCPSGKLAASWARLEAYAGMETVITEKLMPGRTDPDGYAYRETSRECLGYPFAFGLRCRGAVPEPLAITRQLSKVTFTVKLTNTGAAAERKTVQLYVTPPVTVIAEQTTKTLAPGEAETLTLTAEDTVFPKFDRVADPGTDNVIGEGSVLYDEDVYMGYRRFDTRRDSLLYPFGFGLSYTDFAYAPGTFTRTDGRTGFTVTVKNTGACAGRETVQLYVRPPHGAPLTLIDYKKTGLLAPGEAETLALEGGDELFASFDEEKHAFVLRAGEYRVLWGTDALTDKKAGVFTLAEEMTVKQCAPLPTAADFVMPAPYEKPDAPVTLDDVKAGRASMEAFIASLTDEELEYLSRGEGNMESPLGVSGNAGIMGGTTESLRAKGLRPIVTSDGPAGLRLNVHASLFPCGTLLACTFDDALAEELLACYGREAGAVGADIVLGPGLNLQRHPLNGRNFEYYSEDPLLSGRMAAAAVRGIQSEGVAACPKHFCCNNKEKGRKFISSDVSERALRELYLRSFEICLKQSRPLTLMTSYNRINDVPACYNYSLVTGVVRNEWGFTGLIMTDWWMIYERSPLFPQLSDNPARIRAGVNVLMPGNRGRRDRDVHNAPETLPALQAGLLGRGELERNAKYAVELQLRLDGEPAAPAGDE